MNQNEWRIARAVLGNFLTVLLYGIGLTGPLTPSEGMPNPVEITIFFVLPVLLLIACARYSRNILLQALIALQILLALGLTGWLFLLQYRTS